MWLEHPICTIAAAFALTLWLLVMSTKRTCLWHPSKTPISQWDKMPSLYGEQGCAAYSPGKPFKAWHGGLRLSVISGPHHHKQLSGRMAFCSQRAWKNSWWCKKLRSKSSLLLVADHHCDCVHRPSPPWVQCHARQACYSPFFSHKYM